MAAAQPEEYTYYKGEKTAFLVNHTLRENLEYVVSATTCSKSYYPRKSVAVNKRVAVVSGKKGKCVGTVAKKGRKPNSKSKQVWVWLKDCDTGPFPLKDVVALPEVNEFVRNKNSGRWGKVVEQDSQGNSTVSPCILLATPAKGTPKSNAIKPYFPTIDVGFQ